MPNIVTLELPVDFELYISTNIWEILTKLIEHVIWTYYSLMLKMPTQNLLGLRCNHCTRLVSSIVHGNLKWAISRKITFMKYTLSIKFNFLRAHSYANSLFCARSGLLCFSPPTLHCVSVLKLKRWIPLKNESEWVKQALIAIKLTRISFC